jgi:hypothetical protein
VSDKGQVSVVDAVPTRTLGSSSDRGGDIQNYAFGTTFSRVGHTGLVELPYLGSWTNSLPATATLYDNSGYWNQTAYTTCLDGYKCFDTWSS